VERVAIAAKELGAIGIVADQANLVDLGKLVEAV
jgi:hypothetical protein